MRVTKEILWPGVYQAPQGTLHATPERVRRWASKFRSMHSKGIKIPVAWGHHPDALPQEGATLASRQEEAARWNAGYLEGMEVSPEGKLRITADIPAVDEVDEQGNLLHWQQLPDGTRVRCAIGEVSASIRDWRDGTGREWPDSIVHVALTPLPVLAGQRGFLKAAKSSSPGEWHLSLACLDLGTSMAKDKDDLDEDLDDEAEGLDEDEAPDLDDDAMPDALEDATPSTAEVTPPADISGTVNEAQALTQALSVLEQHGLHMAPGTTMQNLLERILVAGHAVASVNATPKPAVEPEPVEPLPEDDALDNPDDLSDEPETEEQRPIMMSTDSLTPREQKLLAKEQERRKAYLLKRIDRLAGKVPGADLQRMRDSLSSYSLSLTDSGEYATAGSSGRVEYELSVWEKVLSTLGTGKVPGRRVKRPDEETGGRSEAEIRRDAEERAARLSIGR